MTTKIKRIFSTTIVFIFIIVSSFLIPSQGNITFFKENDKLSAENVLNTKGEDKKTDDQIKEKEDTGEANNFTTASLNIIYYLFHKYLQTRSN